MVRFYECARRMLPRKRMAMTVDWTLCNRGHSQVEAHRSECSPLIGQVGETVQIAGGYGMSRAESRHTENSVLGEHCDVKLGTGSECGGKQACLYVSQGI